MFSLIQKLYKKKQRIITSGLVTSDPQYLSGKQIMYLYKNNRQFRQEFKLANNDCELLKCETKTDGSICIYVVLFKGSQRWNVGRLPCVYLLQPFC